MQLHVLVEIYGICTCVSVFAIWQLKIKAYNFQNIRENLFKCYLYCFIKKTVFILAYVNRSFMQLFFKSLIITSTILSVHYSSMFCFYNELDELVQTSYLNYV